MNDAEDEEGALSTTTPLPPLGFVPFEFSDMRQHLVRRVDANQSADMSAATTAALSHLPLAGSKWSHTAPWQQ
eukprot:1038793-Prorocentrum_minimum.AAC.2